MVVVAGLPNARQLFNAAQAVLNNETKKVAPARTKDACNSPEPAFPTTDVPPTHTFQLNLARSVYYDNDVIEGTVQIECTNACEHEQYSNSRFTGFDLASPAYSLLHADHTYAELGLTMSCELTCEDGKDKSSHVLYQDYTLLATDLRVGGDHTDLPIHLPFRVMIPSGEPPTLNIANCCISWGVRLVQSEKANSQGVGSKVLLSREIQKACLYKPRAGLVPRAYAERRSASLGGSIRRRSNSACSNSPNQHPQQRPSSPPLSSPSSLDSEGLSSPLENIAAEYVSASEEINDGAASDGLYIRASLSRDVYSIGEPTTVTLWVHHPPGGSTLNPLMKIRKIKASIVQQAQVFVEGVKTLSQEQTLDTSYLPTPHTASCSWETVGDGIFCKKFTLVAGSKNEADAEQTQAQHTRSLTESPTNSHPSALPEPSFSNGNAARSTHSHPSSSSSGGSPPDSTNNNNPLIHRLGLRPFHLDFKTGFTRPRQRADSVPRHEFKRSISCPTRDNPVSPPLPTPQKINSGSSIAPTIRKTTIKGRRGSTETTVVSVKYHVEVRVSFYCRADVKLVLPFSLSSALDSSTLEADCAHSFSTGPAIPRPVTPPHERVELPETETCSTDRLEAANRRELFMSLCAQHAPVDHPPPYHRLEGESVCMPPPTTSDSARNVDPVGFFARPGPLGAFSWFDRTGHESPCCGRLPQPAERSAREPTAEERFFSRTLAGLI